MLVCCSAAVNSLDRLGYHYKFNIYKSMLAVRVVVTRICMNLHIACDRDKQNSAMSLCLQSKVPPIHALHKRFHLTLTFPRGTINSQFV